MPQKVWTAQECYDYFLELGLTRREAEVAVQAGKGLSNKEIAMELNITEATVKKHIAKVLEKLGVEKREQIMDKSFIDKTTGKRYNQFTRSNQ